jgi:hypothetical protein
MTKILKYEKVNEIDSEGNNNLHLVVIEESFVNI